MIDILKEELDFCINLWKKQGYCNFGGKTKCKECATPYLLYKLITKKVLHDKKMKRLSLDEWNKLLEEIHAKS